jgi:cysteine desulfurase
MSHIYLDNAASTPLLPEVYEAMRPYLVGEPGNPASSHAFGRRARRALEDAREQIAALLDAEPDAVIFTSGATEANNLALFGLVGPPGTIVTSAIEHPCVLEPAQRLAERGFRHVQWPVTREGVVDLVACELPQDTRLVSVMLANHETGALQPVEELVRQVNGRAVVHCDAAAAAGKVAISFRRLGVDALTISAHKFHGPPGVGALILRRAARLQPQLWGGHQQQGKRPGTEPVALAVGMATALAWCAERIESNRAKVRRLQQLFVDELRARANPVVVHGPADALPYVVNVSFPGCRADALMMKLDLAGVACSTGSACSSGSLLPSHVLTAMGLEKEELISSLRFSFNSRMDEAESIEGSNRISLAVKDLRILADFEA